jgi:flagellar FliL protein
MAADKDPAEKADGAGKTRQKFDPKMILGALLILLNFGGLGVGAFVVYKGTLGVERPVLREPAAMDELKKERKENEKDGLSSLTYTMAPFTVNLSGNPQRIIRVEMTLEMLDEEGFEEVVRLGPQARDSIVKILNLKEFSDLETIQGKLFLKDQIAVTLNQSLKSGVVKDIYFSDFVVQ